ncbi:unnamed protein product [Acanthoscelides obtectus]|uniref:Uncharacterized protein n=1 Tax=Acanthoscelides obtectus TaxID=200917 RepID=A0A9P0LLP5_ACAOB|nr:unnamed protein product [Acanthoscelides obtectus]CAK1643837.1 hypothetical protein AOBTE_LOCUS13697 [Acanthoscelides obtectus]
MASSRQKIRATDKDFETIAQRSYEEVKREFSDQDDDIQDPDYYNDHDSTSEIENNEVNSYSASEEELEPEMEEINVRAHYGKDV